MSPDPGVSWVVTGNGVEVVGEKVGEPRNGMQLWKVQPPARFRNTQTGIFPDGWMSSSATFSQYAPENGASRGFSKVVVSRQGACGAASRRRTSPSGSAPSPWSTSSPASRGSTRSSGASSPPAA